MRNRKNRNGQCPKGSQQGPKDGTRQGPKDGTGPRSGTPSCPKSDAKDASTKA